MGYKDNKIKKTLFINEYFHYCIHLNQLYQLIFVQNLIAHYQEGPIAFFPIQKTQKYHQVWGVGLVIPSYVN